jgi:hypothetical protein
MSAVGVDFLRRSHSCASLAAVLVLLSACAGASSARRDTVAANGSSGAAASATMPAPGSPAATSPRATPSHRPAAQRTATTAASSRPRTTKPPLSLTLTKPLPPFDGGVITALYQDTCGDPSRGSVYIEVADPANISSVWYEYHVHTPVPFDGENRNPSVADNFRVWRGGLGPFAADPRNADGGPIVVTAHGLYRDGTVRTATMTWTLKPCHG